MEECREGEGEGGGKGEECVCQENDSWVEKGRGEEEEVVCLLVESTGKGGGGDREAVFPRVEGQVWKSTEAKKCISPFEDKTIEKFTGSNCKLLKPEVLLL